GTASSWAAVSEAKMSGAEEAKAVSIRLKSGGGILVCIIGGRGRIGTGQRVDENAPPLPDDKPGGLVGPDRRRIGRIDGQHQSLATGLAGEQLGMARE